MERHPSICRLLAIALLLLAAPALAQRPDVGGTWTDIDLDAAVGIPNTIRATRPGTLHFYDSLNGIRQLSGLDTVLVTTDGGMTWTQRTSADPVDLMPPLPAGWLPGGFAWLRTGETSTDAGRTWRAPSGGTTVDMTASSALMQTAIARNERPADRLRTTTDGGATWRFLDRLGPAGASNPGLDSGIASTVYGALPVPPGMKDPYYSWAIVVEQQGSVVEAILNVSGTVDAAPVNANYLVTIDVAAGSIRSAALPMLAPLNLTLLRSIRPIVHRRSPQQIIAAEHVFDTYFMEWPLASIWLSQDDGATWVANDTLVWIDYQHVRFFSPGSGVTSNAVTGDGGRTWQRTGRPFGADFFALDSAHWYVTDSYELGGRTSDAGETWRRSPSKAALRAMVAHAGHVVIARTQRSVLTSSDRGATWIDVGAYGGLPDDLVNIVAMTFLDTAELPGSIAAVGAFVDRTGRRSAGFLKSSDYGRTWTEGTPLPLLNSFVFGSDIFDVPLVMESVPGVEGAERSLFIGGPFGLTATTDDGATWESRGNELAVHDIAMVTHTHGVMLSVDWSLPATTLHRTVDGGRTWIQTYASPENYTFPVGLQLVPDGYRVIASSFSDGYRSWIALSSIDGAAWSVQRGTHGGPTIKGADAYWSDGRRAHVVARGGSILFSRDGAASFEIHHDSLRSYYYPRQDDPATDMIYRPLLSARDGRDIYVATHVRQLARWTIGDGVLAAPAARADERAFDVSVRVADDRSSAELYVASPAPVRAAWLVDLRGERSVIALVSDADGYRGAIDLAGVSSGAYLVIVEAGTERVSVPVIIGN